MSGGPVIPHRPKHYGEAKVIKTFWANSQCFLTGIGKFKDCGTNWAPALTHQPSSSSRLVFKVRRIFLKKTWAGARMFPDSVLEHDVSFGDSETLSISFGSEALSGGLSSCHLRAPQLMAHGTGDWRRQKEMKTRSATVVAFSRESIWLISLRGNVFEVTWTPWIRKRSSSYTDYGVPI